MSILRTFLLPVSALFFLPSTSASLAQNLPGLSDLQRCQDERYSNFASAVRYCDRALLSRQQLPLDTVIEIYIARAQAYEFAKEFDKALSDYTSAIAENPDDSKAYRLRAQFYSTIMKDVDRAIADYTRILTIEPRHIGVLMDRGVAFLQKSLYDQALDDFKKVIEIDPQYGSAYIQLSIIMLKKGDFPAALQDAEQAIRLTSNEPGVQWAAFKVGGDASLALGHRDEAIRYYRQASALASRYPILRTQAEEAMRDAFKTLGITP